jgi:hypothetical protein
MGVVVDDLADAVAFFVYQLVGEGWRALAGRRATAK